jgi:hypothetical protein
MEAAKEWVDFKAVKAAVSMQMVFDRYGITELKQAGGELRGPCPIHKGKAGSRQFSVNLTKNAFQCFFSDCKARGNVLDFVAAMEGCSVRDAALKLASWFGVEEREPASEIREQPQDGLHLIPFQVFNASTGERFTAYCFAGSGDQDLLLVPKKKFIGTLEVSADE